MLYTCTWYACIRLRFTLIAKYSSISGAARGLLCRPRVCGTNVLVTLAANILHPMLRAVLIPYAMDLGWRNHPEARQVQLGVFDPAEEVEPSYLSTSLSNSNTPYSE